jgi:hypothetical protein
VITHNRYDTHQGIRVRGTVIQDYDLG